MYVKALKISGFKSFADPTVLEFEPGVNVIVGPNGSGKSNIADALSWVLGSQAPSTLRGASMEDVIFAGSAGHPRLGMAEVELTLDNSSGVLPLDLAEVTVSRYTDRAGVSEYRINGAPCRLLDVAELLSDTGIGRSIHTVVGQGQLDQILHARPEDRRAFIEEAAQVGKYRRRKDRSLRKLERVDDNLVRLEDVLGELRRTLRPLKRQANAASAYSELLSVYTQLKQRLAGSELRRLEMREGELDLESETKRASLLGDELANVEALLGTAAGERASAQAAAEDARSTVHRMNRAVDRLSALGRLAEERAGRIAARLAAETEETYRERIKLLEVERDRWNRAGAELKAKSEAAGAALATAREEARAAADALQGADRALGEARAAEISATQALVRAEGSEAASRATLGSVEARVHAVMERREVALSELAEATAAIGKAEREVTSLEAELDRVTEAAASAELTLEMARDRAKELTSALGSTHADVAAADARVRAFEEVVSLFTDKPDVATRIGPLITSARERAQVANASEADARRILGEAEEAVEARWQEVSKQDAELRRLDALLSGAAERLAGTRRQKEAREIELAALNEELSRAREGLATAERAAAEERAALPQHQAEVEQARVRRSEAEARVEEARTLATEASSHSTSLQMEFRTAEERALAAQLRYEEAEAGIGDAEKALEGLEQRRTDLERSRRRAFAVAEAALLAADRGKRWTGDANAHAEEARRRADAVEDRLGALRARERELNHNIEEAAQRRHAAEIRQAEMRARAAAVAERALEEWGMTAEQLRDLDGFPIEEEDQARQEVQRLEREMKKIGTVNPRAAEEYAELAERETFLVEQIEDLRTSRRDLTKVIREVDDQIIEVFSEAFEAVAAEFEGVFERLFPGGSGKLKLTNPEDLLGSGIEVEARPPGKNVRKLSLLSGGERSLVALAFLFSIFRSRPSPFYLLDEVEAALDDINLQRFLTLVDELERSAQILIVTHQKRTMEAADVLYGVSMAKDGVSSVIARRMEDSAHPV
jgi:chromosome segregation protein